MHEITLIFDFFQRAYYLLPVLQLQFFFSGAIFVPLKLLEKSNLNYHKLPGRSENFL